MCWSAVFQQKTVFIMMMLCARRKKIESPPPPYRACVVVFFGVVYVCTISRQIWYWGYSGGDPQIVLGGSAGKRNHRPNPLVRHRDGWRGIQRLCSKGWRMWSFVTKFKRFCVWEEWNDWWNRRLRIKSLENIWITYLRERHGLDIKVKHIQISGSRTIQ